MICKLVDPNHPILAGLDVQIAGQKVVEAHESDEVIIASYCKKNRHEDLCNIKKLAHTPSRLHGHPNPPQINLETGVIEFPSGLVPPVASAEDLWTRAKQFRKLSVSEQMKSLHHFQCVKAAVVYLQGQYLRFQKQPELASLWAWVISLNTKSKGRITV